MRGGGGGTRYAEEAMREVDVFLQRNDEGRMAPCSNIFSNE